MILDKVSFTGLEFDPRELSQGRKTGPFPLDWTRMTFPVPASYYFEEINWKVVDRWIEETLSSGKSWGSYVMESGQRTFVIFYFEDLSDAVMFKMFDGHEVLFKHK